MFISWTKGQYYVLNDGEITLNKYFMQGGCDIQI